MNTFKKLPAPRKPEYSPLALVREHGDYWWAHIPSSISPATVLDLIGQSIDSADALEMELMEKGISPRVRVY